MSCRGKLAKLDEKLTLMEQRVEYIEARVCKNSQFSLPIKIFICDINFRCDFYLTSEKRFLIWSNQSIFILV